MNDINYDDLYFDSAFNPKDSTSNGNTNPGWTGKIPSLEEMMGILNDLPTIYIWKSNLFPLTRFNLVGDKPKLILSPVVETNKAYIVCGIGIYAGSKAYKYLMDNLVQLKWSDEYIPIEKQEVCLLLPGIESANEERMKRLLKNALL